MTFETGIFHETYTPKNFNLPIKYIIEDNGLCTNTQLNSLGIKLKNHQGT